MANLKASGEPLDTAWQRLTECWAETKGQWNDSVRRQFEQEFWEPLAQQVPATQRELERLARVIAQAQRNVK